MSSTEPPPANASVARRHRPRRRHRHRHHPRSHPPALHELVLPGGGTNGLVVVGVLHALHQHGSLDHVRRWVGGSAGATTALFMVLGYSPKVLYDILLRLDFATLNDVTCDSILGAFDTMGLSDGDRLLSIVRAALVKRGFTEKTTFDELARSIPDRELVITGYNLTRGETVAFSARTTPSMPVWLACRITVAVPLLFRPVMYSGDLYTDGCVLENVPVRFAKNTRHTLVLKTTSMHPEGYRDPHTRDVQPPPTSLLGFVSLLHKRMSQALDHATVNPLTKKHPERVLVVRVPPSPCNHFVVDFGMTPERKEALFLAGHRAGEVWVDERRTNE